MWTLAKVDWNSLLQQGPGLPIMVVFTLMAFVESSFTESAASASPEPAFVVSSAILFTYGAHFAAASKFPVVDPLFGCRGLARIAQCFRHRVPRKRCTLHPHREFPDTREYR